MTRSEVAKIIKPFHEKAKFVVLYCLNTKKVFPVHSTTFLEPLRAAEQAGLLKIQQVKSGWAVSCTDKLHAVR